MLNPMWLEEPSWAEVAGMANRLSAVDATKAKDALRGVFGAAWASTAGLEHRVAGEARTYVGRLAILELGHALALVGGDVGETMISRLQDPREYFGAAAELRAALLLLRSDAVLEREPCGTGPRLSEYAVRWRSGVRAVVEVKALNVADEVRLAERVVSRAMLELMRLAQHVPGLRGRVEWDDAILDTPPDDDAISCAVNVAMTATRAAVNADSGTDVPIQGVGVMHLAPDPSQPQMHLEYGGFAPSNAAVYRRMRRRANDALQQLASHPALPGVIILDVDADGLARNGLDGLARWARGKSQLGAVLVIEREYVRGRGYGNVRLLEGARFDEVVGLASALESCESGHVHYQPMSAPDSPCPTSFWLSEMR